jgi:hypothetical protein
MSFSVGSGEIQTGVTVGRGTSVGRAGGTSVGGGGDVGVGGAAAGIPQDEMIIVTARNIKKILVMVTRFYEMKLLNTSIARGVKIAEKNSTRM